VHDNGSGQTYVDCHLLGTPGDPSTYDVEMATDAANASTVYGTLGSLTCGTSACLQNRGTASNKQCNVWCYAGPLAGYVTIDATSNTCVCPTTAITVSNRTWN
jgi:hypothetical protein